MMTDDLPQEYDAIILGTGTSESIVAAALARIGWKVLHLDRNDYYSGDWACFNLQGMTEWLEKLQTGKSRGDAVKKSDFDASSVLEGDEALGEVDLNIHSTTISNVCHQIHVQETPPPKQPQVVDASDESEEKQTGCEGQDNDETSGCEGQDNDETSRRCELETKISEASETETKNSEDEGVINAMQEVSITDTKPDNSPIDAATVQTPSDTSYTKCQVAERSNEKNDDGGDGGPKKWYYSDIMREWRKFNIDLCPKIQYCRGAMVELLISSDVAKYCEFRTLTRVLTVMEGNLQQVPCSRADVFNSKKVSMIEKRMLMKLLTFCMEFDKHPDEYKKFENKPFVEFLSSKKLSTNVKHFVQHSIAMATNETSTIEGLQSTQKFLLSLGRYGNTAFLWLLYGSGELPQCFCRMCAVFGGVYCLRRTAQHLVFDNSDPAQRKCVGVIDTTGLKLKSKWVVMEASYVPDAILPTPLIKRHISRGILITDRSLQPDTSENITLLRLPAGQCGSQPITVLELSSLSLTVPKDLYIVHLTSSSVTTAKEDFSEAVDLLFHQDTDDDADNRPVILWSAYFNVADTTGIGHHNSVLADQNLLVLSGPNADLDFDHPIEEARAVFEKMCPGEEFLPKAPNPEDIIYNDGEGNQAKESGFEPETPSEASTAETPATASATPEVTTLTETTEDASKSATDKSTDKGENYRESEKETDIMEVLQEDGTSQTFRDAGEVKSPAPKEEASEQSTVIESAPQENTQNKESIS